jgi:hypothetical protein
MGFAAVARARAHPALALATPLAGMKVSTSLNLRFF